MKEPTLPKRPAGWAAGTSRGDARRAFARAVRGALWMLGLLGLLVRPAHAAQYSEPDLFLFGKVVNVHQGSAHQLFTGTIQVTMVNEGNPQQILARTIELRPVGRLGEYSYRTSIPLYNQPNATELNSGLLLRPVASAFKVLVATLEGASLQMSGPVPLKLTEPAQLNQILISGNARGKEFRLDFTLSQAELDSDGDGLPDWWEDLHRLNKYSAADAVQDSDADGLTSLQEFQKGTDPNRANTSALVLDTQFQVPVGGTAGLALNVINQGSSPTDNFLSCPNPTAGLTWRLQGTDLPAGEEFTYQDVLEGRVSVGVSRSFSSGAAQLNIRDATPAKTNGPVQFDLWFEGISPSRGIAYTPAIWLDAALSAPEGQAIAEWTELSGAQRDGYQPAGPAQPLSQNGQVRFQGGRFFYLDDRGLNSPEFTAFLSFDADQGGSASQTVFRTANLQLNVERNFTNGTRYLSATQSGRATLAPVAQPGANVYTVTAGATTTQLEAPDQGVALSSSNATSLKFAFPTLGALFPVTASAPSNTLQGNIREIVLFDATLPPATRAVLQDYQLSRWQGFLLWDYTRAVLPLSLAGSDADRNILNGGLGDDIVHGGQRGDILRGGPGRNTLTGGPGPDRFAFSRTYSLDVVTDFSAAEGDVIDLTELMDSPSGGTPPDVTVGPVVTRGTNSLPRVDTLIEIRYAGPGAAVDQVITLQNVGELPAFALRLPATGTIPAPPVFVTVETAGSAVADGNWQAAVPNVVDGSSAVDRNGAPVTIFQDPTAGTAVGLGSTVITLTARDDKWNTANTATTFLVTIGNGGPSLTWSRTADGGLKFNVPAGAVLEAASEVAGPWETVPGSGEVVIPPDQPQRFFRLRSN